MSNDVIDIHIHFGAPDDPCYWSPEFESSVAHFAMRVITGSLFKDATTEEAEKHMVDTIKQSKYTGKGVLLAMDWVYDSNDGSKRKDLTHLYVPNHYLASLARQHDEILFGASVHPYREDWEDELQFCLDNGAVLCKWIPSTMLINPEDGRCDAFYQKLKDNNLPLLCHGGPEHSIPTSDKDYNKFNNPRYFRKALEAGVTVIVPHCAMPFWGELEDSSDFLELRALFQEAAANDWKLYADLSAICIPTRIKFVEQVKNEFPLDKLIYGSDYPIPVSEFSYSASSNFFKRLKVFLEVMFTGNFLDKNYLLIKEMEFGEQIFENAHDVLRLP